MANPANRVVSFLPFKYQGRSFVINESQKEARQTAHWLKDAPDANIDIIRIGVPSRWKRLAVPWVRHDEKTLFG